MTAILRHDLLVNDVFDQMTQHTVCVPGSWPTPANMRMLAETAVIAVMERVELAKRLSASSVAD